MTKTMTVKEIAEILNLDPRTVQLKVKELFPEKVKNGYTTHLDEKDVTTIKLDLEKKFEVTTDLEMLLLSKKVDQWKDSKIAFLQKENNSLKIKIDNLEPKAIRYDTFISNKSSQKIGDVAKIFGIKPNTLHQMLRDAKIMQENYVPYAQYQYLFKTVETPTPAGFNKFTSYLLPEGVAFIARKFNLIELPKDQIAQIN
jgi:phage antirepressor YoqD-like protein